MVNISIIIPNYNGASFLSVCLSSLQKAIIKCPQSKFEIILVDNASTDDSITIFKSFSIPNSKFIILNSNQGFAAAVNRGIKDSSYDYVCLCNNDLTVSPDWFNIITKTITDNKNTKIATYCGLVLNKEGTHIESEGLKFFTRGKALNIHNGLPYSKGLEHQRTSVLIWGSSAALVVYKKEIITKIGLFDEDFFAYEEDVDIALRLHNLGFLTLYTPWAISYHLGGGTSSKMANFRQIHDAQNWIYLILKNYSLNDIFTNIFPIIEERLRNCSGLIKNTPVLELPYTLISTYFKVLLSIPKILNKRKMLNYLK